MKCKSTKCVPDADKKLCMDCCVEFVSQDCYDRHNVHTTYGGGRESQSVCQKCWQCTECRQYFETRHMSKQDHNCGEMYCRNCKKWDQRPQLWRNVLQKLQEVGAKKGDFPHDFNVSANYGYVGPYPAIQYYGVDGKKEEDRKEFIQWYESVKNNVFDFEQELFSYCVNDVDILSRVILEFRKNIMLEETKVDPLNQVTIASTTMTVFKQNFLEEHFEPGTDTFIGSDLALVPATGYVSRDNYSRKSIIWLEWIKSNNPRIIIQHALTDCGEYRVPGTNYRVDGYCEQTRTIYEFLGCLWHGCCVCHPDRQRPLAKTNETADLLYNKTMDRIRHLESLHYKVVTIWEYEFCNLDLGEMDLDIQTRLNLRDSFY